MADFKRDYPKKFLLIRNDGVDVTTECETETLDEMMEIVELNIYAYENEDDRGLKLYSIWELPAGKIYTLPDGKVSDRKLTDAEMIRVVRANLTEVQNSVGFLGRYFYKSKVLHYGGLLLYVALGLVSIYFLVDDIRNHMFNWVDLTIVVVYIALSPAFYHESKEVHDIWRDQKLLSKFK